MNSSLRFLIDAVWWKETFKASLRFAPKCILGAVLLTIANIAMVAANIIFYSKLGNVAGSQDVTESTLVELMALGVGSLLLCLVGLGLSIWGLSLWLFRLTQFARTYKLCGASADDAAFQASADNIRAKKGFLWQFWLTMTLYSLGPLLALFVCVALTVVSRPDFAINGVRLVPLPSWLDPQLGATMSIIGAGVVIFLLTAYMFIAIVFSALSEQAPSRRALDALKECARHAIPVTLVTAVVTVVNLVITTPISLLAPFVPMTSIEQNLWLMVAVQIWLGVTSTFVWPASVATFCMITSPPEVQDEQREVRTA